MTRIAEDLVLQVVSDANPVPHQAAGNGLSPALTALVADIVATPRAGRAPRRTTRRPADLSAPREKRFASRHSKMTKAAVAAVAAVAVTGGGLAAAGTQVLPSFLTHAMWGDPVSGAYNAEPASSRLILTTDGPAHRPMQLWYADSTDHGYCLELKRLPSSRVSSADPRAGELSGDCGGPAGGPDWNKFGGAYGGASDSAETTFIARTADAVRVVLVLGNGKQTSLVVNEGWTAGWFPTGQSVGSAKS